MDITIPDGIVPGDRFTVVPPSIMVLVPTGTKPGSFVMFRRADSEWFAAEIPEELRPGGYFVARIPPKNAIALEFETI